MTTIEKNIETKDNEIDLIDILSRIWSGLTRVVKITAIFLIRKSLWLLGFIVLGSIIAYLFYSLSSRYYTSMMMAQVNVLSNVYVVDYVNQLGKITDTLTRARIFNIPVSAAKHVSDVSAFFGIDTDRDRLPNYIDLKNTVRLDSKDTTRKIVPGIFYVQIRVSDESIFPSLSQGIITALKNNPHLVEQNRVRIDQLYERIAEYETQYQILDSLEQFEYFNSERSILRTTGQVLVLNEKERQLYHAPLFSIHANLLRFKEELALHSEPVTILQDFSTLSVTDNPLTSYLKKWVLIFFFAGIVFLIIRHNRKKIWKLITDKSY